MTAHTRATEAGARALVTHGGVANPLEAAHLSQVVFTAIAAEGFVVVPAEATNEVLDALALECRSTWGVNVEKRAPMPIGKHEWRERMRPLHRAILTAAQQEQNPAPPLAGGE